MCVSSTGTPFHMSPKLAMSLPDGELDHSNFTVSFGILQRTIGDSSDHLCPCLFHHITSFYSVLNLMMTLSDLLSHRIVQQNYSANDVLWGRRACLSLFLVSVTKKGRSYCLDVGHWQVTLSRSGQSVVVWLSSACRSAGFLYFRQKQEEDGDEKVNK